METTALPNTPLSVPTLGADSREPLLSRIFSAHPNKAAVLTGSLAFLALIACLDRLTSPVIHLPLLYIVPCAAVTWFVGRKSGHCVGVLSAFVQLAAEVIEPDIYTHPSRAYWNTVSRLIFYVLLVTLISAKKELTTRMGAMVEERTRALRKLAMQLSDAENSERRRLATDIHDSLSQTLSLLKLSLSAALAVQPEDTELRRRTDSALTTVNALIQSTRTLMFDLYPAMLDHLGLCQTLRFYGEEFSRHTAIELIVSEEGQPQTPSRTTANYLFRSTKELVNNAAKHGRAKEIVVSLRWMPSTLRVVVDDDGTGFDPSQSFTPDQSKGIGLAAIHERLGSLGGRVRIESAAGNGARVVLEAPLGGMDAGA